MNWLYVRNQRLKEGKREQAQDRLQSKQAVNTCTTELIDWLSLDFAVQLRQQQQQQQHSPLSPAIQLLWKLTGNCRPTVVWQCSAVNTWPPPPPSLPQLFIIMPNMPTLCKRDWLSHSIAVKPQKDATHIQAHWTHRCNNRWREQTTAASNTDWSDRLTDAQHQRPVFLFSVHFRCSLLTNNYDSRSNQTESALDPQSAALVDVLLAVSFFILFLFCLSCAIVSLPFFLSLHKYFTVHLSPSATVLLPFFQSSLNQLSTRQVSQLARLTLD